MSEIDRGWGVVERTFYVQNLSRPIYRCVPTGHPKFHQASPRLKASGLTADEADALCKLLNAGVSVYVGD